MSVQKTQCEIQCIYSGYAMSSDDFNNLIFKDMKFPQSKKNDLNSNVFAYDRWQRRLPKVSRARVPALRREFHSQALYKLLEWLKYCTVFLGQDNNKSVVIRLLFATRVVRYHSPNQLDQNGAHTGLWHPDEADLARLEEFRKFVEPLGGRINVDKLEFTATKDRGWCVSFAFFWMRLSMPTLKRIGYLSDLHSFLCFCCHCSHNCYIPAMSLQYEIWIAAV